MNWRKALHYQNEFGQFISKCFEKAGYRVEAGAVEAILDHSEDVPYNVQALSSVAWEVLGDEGAM